MWAILCSAWVIALPRANLRPKAIPIYQKMSSKPIQKNRSHQSSQAIIGLRPAPTNTLNEP